MLILVLVQVHLRPNVQSEFEEHANEERKHAEMIAKRIIELEGVPVLDPQKWSELARCKYDTPQDFDSVCLLNDNVASERCAILRYQEIADALKGVDIPVLVKNPVNPDLELWIGALERINNAGLKRLGAIHRGFSSYDKKLYRNLPQWHIPIELRRRLPELPIFCDPSHIGGKRELVAPLCQQAMDLNFDGLIVESHCNPDCAWSDAAQQVTPDVLDYILNLLVIRKETQTTENLSQLRKQIDECDDNIIQELAKRMRVAREIGTYKKEHGITVLQRGRYNEILEKRGAQGEQCGMGAEFMKTIFEAIHEESVRQQMEIINK